MTNILHVNTSARHDGSASRRMSAHLVAKLTTPTTHLTQRDVVADAAFLTEEWIAASFTPLADRTPDQHMVLSTSDRLAQEVLDADILVLGVAMYNFGIPSALKAWIDQISRPGLTFRPDPVQTYVGLATGKTAYVVVSTGETPVGSEMDFITPYLQHILGFLGIADVRVIAADMTVSDPDTVTARAVAQIDAVI